MKTEFKYASGTNMTLRRSERAFKAAEEAFGRPADLAKRSGTITVTKAEATKTK